MESKFSDRLKHAWNAFTNKDPTFNYNDLGSSYSFDHHSTRSYFSSGNEQTIIASFRTRIAMDVSQIAIQHCRTDPDGRFKDVINSDLNECLTVSANIDQTSRAFIQDVVESMLDEGVVAIVPVDTDIDPINSGSFKIQSLRTGLITDWYPRDVRISVYNDQNGRREEIVMPKSKVAIVINPLYSVMNEPNSTYKRLVRKLGLLDVVDEQSGSGKLDLIVQLPYGIKSDTRRSEAQNRLRMIEDQLQNTKHGIAYLDATEKITQLNRSIDNNLMSQIEYLTALLYSQLGITQEIFNGTATIDQMNNYNSKTVEPIVAAIVDEMNRKFLTKTARSQYQKIMYFKDPFQFIPVSQIADMADKFTRNEIMTSNEFRKVIGMKASDDPNADVLRNKNLSVSNEEMAEGAVPTVPSEPEEGGE